MNDDQFKALCNTYGFAPSRALRELIDCAVARQEILDEVTPQRKPLTEEEIQELSQQHKFDSRIEKFVRIIEQAHGIK